MIVVSDTSPLNDLVLIGAIDVLPKLFGEIYVPEEVMRELQLELKAAFDALRRSSFRITQAHIDTALARDAARKKNSR